MNAGTFVLIIVLGVLLTGVGVIVAVSRSGNSERLSRQERRELEALRDTLDRIDTLAYSHRELDSALSVQVLDEIANGKRAIRGRK